MTASQLANGGTRASGSNYVDDVRNRRERLSLANTRYYRIREDLIDNRVETIVGGKVIDDYSVGTSTEITLERIYDRPGEIVFGEDLVKENNELSSLYTPTLPFTALITEGALRALASGAIRILGIISIPLSLGGDTRHNASKSTENGYVESRGEPYKYDSFRGKLSTGNPNGIPPGNWDTVTKIAIGTGTGAGLFWYYNKLLNQNKNAVQDNTRVSTRNYDINNSSN